MPAARGTKRGAKAVASEPKKQRVEPGLAGVVEAIEKAADLPEPCRALLAAVAPTCFPSEVGEQLPHEATIVSWIGDVLDGLRAKLQDAVDEANALASDGDAAKSALDGKASEAQGALVAAMEGVVAARSGVEEASERVATAAAGLSEAQENQRHAADTVEKVKSEKESLEAVLSSDFHFASADVLLPIAKCAGLDESLLLALPAACAKPPDARGPFDTAVLDQVQSGIAKKVEEMEVQFSAAVGAEGGAKERVESAQAGAEEAEQKKQAAADRLGDAERQKAEAQAALGEAEAALEALVRERAPQEKARQEKVDALAAFTTYNLESFKVLQTKAAPAGA